MAKTAKRVGSSAGRSAIKHGLHKKFLGKVVGVASTRVVYFIDKLVIIEACAGDAISNPYSGTSSPEISLWQFFCALELGLAVELFLIERDAFAVVELTRNIESWIRQYLQNKLDLWQDGEAEYNRLFSLVHIIHDDYRSAETAVKIKMAIGRRTAVYLYVDPNVVHDVELSDALRSALPDLTTVLVTLGCNAGGVKMLPYEGKRSKWRDQLDRFVGLMCRNHDGCLISLKKDDSQWAYFLTIPYQWRIKVEEDVESLAKLHWAKGVEYRWFRDSEFEFWELADRLFLTKKERDEKVRASAS